MPNLKEADAKFEYTLKFLNEHDLNQILYLQDLVGKKLSDPTTYYMEPEQFFRQQLVVEKSAVGVFQKEKLVGFHMASFPGLSEDNLGMDVGLTQEELLQVAQMGPTAVHPDHRRKNLLQMIHEKHLRVVKGMGYEHICLTISPSNYPSIRATMHQGFVIKRLKLKFNNLLRYVLHLDVKNQPKQPHYSIRVTNTDIELQKFIISLGFYGYDILETPHGYDVVFGCDLPEQELK